MTFGGRLAPDTPGAIARAMAKDHAGDWRNPDRVRAWAREIAASLTGDGPQTREGSRP